MPEKPVGQHAYEAAQRCRLGKDSLVLTMNVPFWDLPPSERAIWVGVGNTVSTEVVKFLTEIRSDMQGGGETDH